MSIRFIPFTSDEKKESQETEVKGEQKEIEQQEKEVEDTK